MQPYKPQWLRAGGSKPFIEMTLRRVKPWSIVALVVAVHSVFYVHFSGPLVAPDQGAAAEYSGMVLRLVQRPPIPILVDAQQDAETDSPLRQMGENPDLLPAAVANEAPTTESFFGGGRHYLPRDLVDKPAHPSLDWKLRAEDIPVDVLSTIIFTAWVDDNGALNHWKIEDQTPPGDWAFVLMTQLAETHMQSAILNGRPVASIGTFEIGFDTRLLR